MPDAHHAFGQHELCAAHPKKQFTAPEFAIVESFEPCKFSIFGCPFDRGAGHSLYRSMWAFRKAFGKLSFKQFIRQASV
jgi:hypothetical protein